MLRPQPDPIEADISKFERLGCLYLTFLNYPAGLSLKQIREFLPQAYSGELESSRRKFIRDREDLESLGMKLECYEPGKALPDGRTANDYVYIPTDEVRHLPELELARDEAGALAALLMRSIRRTQHSDTQTAALLRSAMVKLLYKNPDTLLSKLDDEHETDQIEEVVSESDAGPLPLIHEAIEKRKVIEFEYVSSGQKKRRHVEGRGLVSYRGRWCLVAYCRDAKEIRLFYTDTMENPKISDETFKPDRKFAIQNYTIHPLSVRNHPPLLVTIETDPERQSVVDDYFSGVPVTLGLKRSGTTVSFQTTNLDALFSWMSVHPGIVTRIPDETVLNRHTGYLETIKGYYR